MKTAWNARPVADRFAEKYVVATDGSGCHVWTAYIDSTGYGRIRVGTRSVVAHKVAWEAANGSVPDGLELDHLCRNRACVNPDHLEAVTHRENVLRGMAPPARQALRTHCPRGHEYDRICRGHRICTICQREQMRQFKIRRGRVAA